MATQAIDRAGELELGVSRRMLKLTVMAASEARDLESIQKCAPAHACGCGRWSNLGHCFTGHVLLR